MVQILKYFELPRVFKRESIHQVEFPKEIRALTENYSEVRNMIKISLSMRIHWGQRGADLGIRLFRGNVDITG